MNITDFIPENYLPAIITSSTALIVAFIGQIYNNHLTIKRENKKYKKEVYEELISEHFIDFLAYPAAVARLIDDEVIEREINISEKLNDMFSKIHYGDSRLQSIYLSYSTLGYMTENHTYNNELKSMQFRICYSFLLYSKKIFKQINFKLENTVKHTLIQTIKEYAVLSIYSKEKSYEEAKNMLISIKRFHLQTLTDISLKDLEKLTNSEIINILDRELEEFLAN